MCVKLALCLALVVCIDGHVLKHRTLPLSAEGMTVEIIVRSKEDPRHPLQTMKIDINETDKKVEMSMAEASPGVLRHLSKANNNVPTLESRNGVMVVGSCPEGFTTQGTFCVPKSDEDGDDY